MPADVGYSWGMTQDGTNVSRSTASNMRHSEHGRLAKLLASAVKKAPAKINGKPAAGKGKPWHN